MQISTSHQPTTFWWPPRMWRVVDTWRQSISTVGLGGDANGQKSRLWPAKRSTGDAATPTGRPVPAKLLPLPVLCRFESSTPTGENGCRFSNISGVIALHQWIRLRRGGNVPVSAEHRCHNELLILEPQVSGACSCSGACSKHRPHSTQ